MFGLPGLLSAVISGLINVVLKIGVNYWEGHARARAIQAVRQKIADEPTNITALKSTLDKGEG